MNPPPTHPPPLYERMKAEERGEGLSISDLCRPLSAAIMPRRAMIGTNGHELTDAVARKNQRRTGNKAAAKHNAANARTKP